MNGSGRAVEGLQVPSGAVGAPPAARFRAVFACSLLLLGLGALLGRLLFLQVVRHEEYRRRAEAQARSLRPCKVTRGALFDINGVLLATSFEGTACPSSLALDWDLLREAGGEACAVKTLLEIGALLGLPQQDVRADLAKARKAEKEGRPLHWLPIYWRASTRGVRSSRIPSHLTPRLLAYRAVYGKIRPPWWRRAVMIEVHAGRHYPFRENRRADWPYRNLCREIIGTVDAFGDGLTGAEGAFDSLLRGRPGWVEERKGPLGDLLSHTRKEGLGVSPLEPFDVYLTIDVRLQQIAWDALREGILRQGAQKGTVLILDPRSGAVRAMATFPPQRSPSALFEVYEPGSIFKCLVAAEALLERKVSIPGPVLWAGGARRFIKGRRRPVEDAHPGHNLTFEDGFVRSSNIVFSIVAERLGSKGMRRLLERFEVAEVPGLCRRLWPVKAAEEFNPWKPKPGPIHPQDVISMGWGNAVMVTCLSLARAYSVLVNGGYLVEPHLIAGVRSDSTGFKAIPTPRARRVLWDERVLKTMKRLLREVVENEHGTAYRLRIPGLPFGGKTGTAKKYKAEAGGYAHKRWYTGGFIAHVPADDPRYVIVAKVDVDRHALAERHLYYGSWTAGPIVRKILCTLFRPGAL